MKTKFLQFVMLSFILFYSNKSSGQWITTGNDIYNSNTGNVGVGTGGAPKPSAKLEVKSTIGGFLMPRLSLAQRNAIASPATGLMIYQTNYTPGFYYYDGSDWAKLATGGSFANKKLDNLTAPTAINQSLLPASSGILDLGSPSFLWRDIYLGGDIYHTGQRILSVSGNFNAFFGFDAAINNTTGAGNTVLGSYAGYSNLSGNSNVMVGNKAGYTSLNASALVLVGDSAGFYNTGSNNSFIGFHSGRTNTSGDNNTFMGAFSDATAATLTNATAIGYKANVSTSNTIVLGDATAATNVAIGATTAGNYKLRVVHSVYGFDIANSISSNNWEQFVTNDPGSTAGGASVTAGDLLLYYNFGESPVGAFDHTTGVYKTTSDERMKTNIKPLPSILDKINQLEAVTYNFKTSNSAIASIGFIAQKVEKIFPSLVSHYIDTTRRTDINLLDYSGFGVIAIKGIQEMQQQMQQKDDRINAQQQQIDELKQMVLSLQQSINDCNLCNKQPENTTAINLNSVSLEQNIPNPFNHSTTINYVLPSQYSTAKIIVVDKSGKVLKEVNISGTGKGNIKIDASTLSSGAYNYSLYVNNKFIDTKQMVLSK